mmetsp:Transcript_15842/g.28751  ORF Transcript_15842/g.28751 Transcript_15842/m.28751 type:complete len:341 (-) Transcript_15842:150-1172(-)|eukprot:CAMPEP_0201933094 /NCGR_PEP_ID=MMETSP0903-20130614/30843_1 /ASSEMBLY_ACC=CAM_ASM_000552 /TAXON_ID=420261 /ORGANISM="Thalassiosira antarctica, Strain CCMP982" /LENGTH=340 /DNA_ID=CAMNT_0048472913 /DNA_START=12 /DNA_END=1034 /DNA_ORIENTATION=-
MSSQEQQQQSQQQQANRGILPSETLNALDYLVDRLNASSGRLPSTTAATATQSKDGDAASTPSSAATGSNYSPLPIRALLVGTNEGVGLSRSLGTAHTASQMQSPNDPSFSHSGSMSEEVLSSIETVWATLVSAAPPHVMAASAAGAASAAASNDENKNEEKKEDKVPPHIQPPHPLLSPLQMGDHIRTVTATYDNCTLIHIHMAPLVVTFITLPEANIGAIRSMALPLLKVLLEPVRRALVRSRGGGAVALGGEGSNGVVAGQMNMTGQTMELQQQAQQAMPFLQQQQQQQNMMGQPAQIQTDMYSGQNAMDPVLQQQLYEQHLYQQQQMMVAQQQFQQ